MFEKNHKKVKAYCPAIDLSLGIGNAFPVNQQMVQECRFHLIFGLMLASFPQNAGFGPLIQLDDDDLPISLSFFPEGHHLGSCRSGCT